MRARIKKLSKLPMALVVIAFLVVLGGAAVAAIPGSDGTVHLCYDQEDAETDRGGGELSVIDGELNTKGCWYGEKKLAINQKGPKGERGPRGPSDAFSTSHGSETAVTDFGTALLELNVPAGSFAVTAKLTIRNTTTGRRLPVCQTSLPGGFDTARAALDAFGAGADMQTLTMNAVGSSDGPGPVQLRCTEAAGLGGLRASDMKITAIQVEDLTNTAG